MKSIGIITIHNSQNNYGGVLQSYALFEYLRSEGYPTEVIDLHRPNNADYIDSIRFRRMRQQVGVRTLIKGWTKELLRIRRLTNPKFKSNCNFIAEEKFNRFNAQVKMSRPFCFIPDLYRNPPEYDVYISGSDQLWNPTQAYCLEPYFLTFVKKKNTKKVSYATSIGIENLTIKEKRKFKRWLQSYDFISVREQSACNLLEEFTGRNIERVPDPTFLLDPEKWINIAANIDENEKYILVFSLEKEQKLLDKAIQIASVLSYKVKVIDQNFPDSSDYKDKVDVVADAGPCDFIGLIKNAKLVITDSFHCTVFSLITTINNFYTYISPEADRGSRIVDLLKIFGLEDHIINNVDAIPNANQLKEFQIDASHILRCMNNERTIGRLFLEKALN